MLTEVTAAARMPITDAGLVGVSESRLESPIEPSAQVLLSAPDVGPREQAAVLWAMRSGWVAPVGPDLTAFEDEVAARVGRAHAVALSSGTAALHLALLASGIGPGDVVPVSTLTFVATANAVRYVGAEPHFVDCDPQTGNVSTDLLRRAVHDLRAAGRRVPAVVVVDMLGKCVDHAAIGAVAAELGVLVISDAAESMGSTRRGRHAGAFGAAAALSFNGNKMMTTSGGGMLLTDDADLAEHVRKLATQAREPVSHYEHEEVGYNYRLSNVLAALGRAQLTRLDEMLQRRREWRIRYGELLAGAPGVAVLGADDDAGDNCWLTALVVDPGTSSWSAADLGAAMSVARIETRPIWKPMHRQPVFADCTATLDGSADHLFARGVVLPSGSAMTEADFARVRAVILGLVGS